ncbi:MAG: hypothetical protein QXI37_03285 [Thermoprotei archaeon]
MSSAVQVFNLVERYSTVRVGPKIVGFTVKVIDSSDSAIVLPSFILDLHGALTLAASYTNMPQTITVTVQDLDPSQAAENPASPVPVGLVGTVNVSGSGETTIGTSKTGVVLVTTTATAGTVPSNSTFTLAGFFNASIMFQPGLVAFDFTTSSTPGTVQQISSDVLPRADVTILADSANSGIVNVGNATSQTFPLIAGASITVSHVSLDSIYVVSSTASQLIHVIAGGSR